MALTLGFPFNYTRFKGGARRIDAIGNGYKTAFAGSLTIGGTYIGQKQGNPGMGANIRHLPWNSRMDGETYMLP